MSNNNQKPKTGNLWYGSRIVYGPAEFRKLAFRKSELIQQGYDKQLFHIHYNYS